MKRISLHTEQGFTIVELLISTAVFSFIMVAVSLTVVEISRLYYKGTVLTRTQDTARNLIEDISRPIQLEGADIIGADGSYFVTKIGPNGQSYIATVVCIGSTRYTYTLNRQVGRNVTSPTDHIRHAVWQDVVPSAAYCTDTSKIPNLHDETPTSVGATSGRDILTERMRLTSFDITTSPGSNNLYTVNVTVMYGDRDLMLPKSDLSLSPVSCASELAGSQWCALANYKTTVMKRIGSGV